MLNDEICKLREELNKSLKNNDDYEKIYKLSVKLDELIARYYRISEIEKNTKDKSNKIVIKT